MEQRRLGDSGLVVSAIGLGCNNLGRPGTFTESPEGAHAVIRAAVDAGITYFDVADVYGSPRGRSEELLGQSLAGHRDSVVIGTKFGMDMQGANGPDFDARGSRRYIRTAVESSLRRLRTDWIDLYQLHRPDPTTPLIETLSTLDDLVHEGKIRYIGLSNLSGWQLADAVWTARSAGLTVPICAQNHYSLLDREAEREIIPVCKRFSLGLLPYFPLANGLLTGKYRYGEPPQAWTRLANRRQLLYDAPWPRIEKVRTLAAARAISMVDLAVGWLAAQPTVGSVIAGATSVDQVMANAEVCWRPNEADRATIDDICPPGIS